MVSYVVLLEDGLLLWRHRQHRHALGDDADVGLRACRESNQPVTQQDLRRFRTEAWWQHVKLFRPPHELASKLAILHDILK
jgi:hypothetical protein